MATLSDATALESVTGGWSSKPLAHSWLSPLSAQFTRLEALRHPLWTSRRVPGASGSSLPKAGKGGPIQSPRS